MPRYCNFPDGKKYESDANTVAEDEDSFEEIEVTPFLSPNLQDVVKKVEKM